MSAAFRIVPSCDTAVFGVEKACSLDAARFKLEGYERFGDVLGLGKLPRDDTFAGRSGRPTERQQALPNQEKKATPKSGRGNKW